MFHICNQIKNEKIIHQYYRNDYYRGRGGRTAFMGVSVCLMIK